MCTRLLFDQMNELVAGSRVTIMNVLKTNSTNMLKYNLGKN